MDAKLILEKLLDKTELSFDEASWMMQQFMDGELSDVQMTAILIALRMKGETSTEIAACASVMREKSTKIPYEHECLIDTCGTGGDRSGSFNISTTVALLLAGAGYKVAKHGNRSMTSKSGSADLLEALGINLSLTPDQVAECLDKVNIGFLFAPMLHSAMKNVMPVRKDLAVRTVFNLLGPLTNPAGAQYQTIGLFSNDLVVTIAEVLKKLGSKSAYVFSGLSGLDEVCIEGSTKIGQLTPSGKINEYVFDPEEYQISKASLRDVQGGSPQDNAEITKDILSGKESGPKKDIVVLNAGFAISVADDCPLEESFVKANQLLNDGLGIKAIEDLSKLTKSFA